MEIEEKILEFCLKEPTYGAQRVSNELRLQNVDVGPNGVRGVWQRHNLETRHRRLLRLEKASQEETIVLSDEQIRLPERHSVDFRLRHVEANRPGELLNQDTFYWGTLKGVGKVYNSKMPITACDLLYDRVLPFYEQLGIEVGSVLTDNGREFCGREDQHPYELLLAMESIEHRRTKVRTPRTNGFVERMNRTLLDECFRIAGRTTWYTDTSEIQRDLDIFMEKYNLRRSHQGYSSRGGPRPRPSARPSALTSFRRSTSLWKRRALRPRISRPHSRRSGGPVSGNYGTCTHFFEARPADSQER